MSNLIDTITARAQESEGSGINVASALDTLRPFTVVYKVDYDDCVEHVMAKDAKDAIRALKCAKQAAEKLENREFFDPDNDDYWTDYYFVAVFAGHLTAESA